MRNLVLRHRSSNLRPLHPLLHPQHLRPRPSRLHNLHPLSSSPRFSLHISPLRFQRNSPLLRTTIPVPRNCHLIFSPPSTATRPPPNPHSPTVRHPNLNPRVQKRRNKWRPRSQNDPHSHALLRLNWYAKTNTLPPHSALRYFSDGAENDGVPVRATVSRTWIYFFHPSNFCEEVYIPI